MAKKKKLTEKEIQEKAAYFEKRVRYYFFDVFKLCEKELWIEEDLDQSCDYFASASEQNTPNGRGVITIRWNRSWFVDYNPPKEDIDLIAFHEVFEVILLELWGLGTERFTTQEELTVASHRVIFRMQNTIFPMVCDQHNEEMSSGQHL